MFMRTLLQTLIIIISIQSLAAMDGYDLQFACQNMQTIPLFQLTDCPTDSFANPWITIWVHGTRSMKGMCKNYFEVPKGMNKAMDFPTEYHHRDMAYALYAQDAFRFDINHFYMFGWSGELSFEAREEGARQLWCAIEALYTAYQAQGMTPRFRIITHSHGGNTALNIALFAPATGSIGIDELILLACPVQEETKPYIQHPVFKQIVSFYSGIDTFQIIDPQKLYYPRKYQHNIPLFSERIFPPQPNLTQIKIRRKHRGLLHVEFLFCEKSSDFLCVLPNLLTYIAQRNISPSATIHVYKKKSPKFSRFKKKHLCCICFHTTCEHQSDKQIIII